MKISIGVVTYNRWKLTEVCIQSICLRTPWEWVKNCDLVVVDNCSTDGTKEGLLSFKSLGYIDEVILNPENYHLGKAINQFYDAADPKSDWLIYIDNDLFVMYGWLENLLTVADDLDLDYVYGVMRIATFMEKTVLETRNGGRYMSPPRQPEIGAGFAIRKKVLDRHNIRFVEDKWRPGWGSNFSVLRRELLDRGLRGVELAKPCILSQNSRFGDPAFEDYYKEVFGIRGTLDRWERLKSRGGCGYVDPKYLGDYYRGSGYDWENGVLIDV